jgi:hypothetical protein
MDEDCPFSDETSKEKFMAIVRTIATKSHFCEIYNMLSSFSRSEIPFLVLPEFNIYFAFGFSAGLLRTVDLSIIKFTMTFICPTDYDGRSPNIRDISKMSRKTRLPTLPMPLVLGMPSPLGFTLQIMFWKIT